MVKTYCIKGVQKKLFADALKLGALENFAKFTGKHLCWRQFLMKLNTCFPMIFVKFSRTPIFQSPLKTKQRFRKNKLVM